jgi:hypothetical protein
VLIVALTPLSCDQTKAMVTPAEPATVARAPELEPESQPEAPRPKVDPPEPEKPAPKCEGKVADVPTALFGDRILIRPPLNVELVEENPTLATTYSSFVSTCDATVDRMQLFVFANNKGKSIRTYQEEFLESLANAGYNDASGTDVIAENDQELTSAVEYPAAGVSPPAKLLVQVARKLDNVIIVFYQTRPSEWDGLSNSFLASTKTLFVVPS